MSMIRFIVPVMVLGFCYCRYFITGPAMMKVLSMKRCKEYEDGDIIMTFRYHMYNKTTQLFDANFLLPFDLDETIKASVKCSRLDKKQSLFTLEEKDLCYTLPKYLGDFFYDMEKKSGIPPGNYTIKNGYIDLEKFKIKMFLEGSFYTRLQFSKGTRILGCFDFEMHLSPK